nr:DnaJ domain-containing protein [uncultured Holophaga sp.]
MNPYEILELSDGASPEEIKAAYHRLAKQWHPDKFSGPSKAEAEVRFRLLAEAFGMLKDVARRAPASAPVPQAEARPTAPSPEGVRIDLQAERSPKERTAEDWFREAKAAFEHGDAQKSLGLIHYAIKLDGERPDYHALMAKAVARATGDKKAESKALETAIRLNPKDVESTIRLAELFQSVGMHARATRLWENARRLEPSHRVFAKKEAQKEGGKKGGKAAEAKLTLAEQWLDLQTNVRLWWERMKERRKS